MTDTIEQIYNELPRLNCKRLCQESCGPIVVTPLEWQRMTERAPHRFIPATEVLLDAQPGQPASTGIMPQTVGEDGATCPLLVNGKCQTYEVRPLLCRLWGSTKKMRCDFGCEPERWLSDKEGYALLDRVVALSTKDEHDEV